MGFRRSRGPFAGNLTKALNHLRLSLYTNTKVATRSPRAMLLHIGSLAPNRVCAGLAIASAVRNRREVLQTRTARRAIARTKWWVNVCKLKAFQASAYVRNSRTGLREWQKGPIVADCLRRRCIATVSG